MEFNEETKAQIVHIQLNDIVKFCAKILEDGYIHTSDAEKVEKMFKIVHDNEVKPSTNETIEPDSSIIL